VKVGEFSVTVAVHALRTFQAHTWQVKFHDSEFFYVDSGPEVLDQAFLNAVKKIKEGKH
jgi:hypothetical protein